MTRRKWVCPECGAAKLGPEKPRKNSAVRFCFDCSAKKGSLVERVCPAVERKREATAAAKDAKRAAKVEARRAKVEAAKEAKKAREREIAAKLTSEGHPLQIRDFCLGVDLRNVWAKLWHARGKVTSTSTTPWAMKLTLTAPARVSTYVWRGRHADFTPGPSLAYNLVLMAALVTVMNWEDQPQPWKGGGNSRANYRSAYQRTKCCDLVIKVFGADKDAVYAANFASKKWSDLRSALTAIVKADLARHDNDNIQIKAIKGLARKLSRGQASARILSQRASLDERGLVLLDRELIAMEHGGVM